MDSQLAPPEVIPTTTKHAGTIDNIQDNGAIYVSGRDSKYRPIVIFDVNKTLSQNLTPDQATQFLSYYFQYIIDHMMVEGQV